jgi:hypothetical protein
MKAGQILSEQEPAAAKRQPIQSAQFRYYLSNQLFY